MHIIDTRSLFRKLLEQYTVLLDSLHPDVWIKPTLATKWSVKDIVSHLIDGDLRVLSMQKNGYFGVNPPESTNYYDIVSWLNQLNHEWITATKRLSPEMLTTLTKFIGPKVCDYFEGQHLLSEAVFPVSWAGEKKSFNWMHLAREYTERWHHQQQIREAVSGSDVLLSKEFFLPMINTLMMGLPHHFRNLDANLGTSVEIVIEEAHWYLFKESTIWALTKSIKCQPNSSVTIPKDISWKLFCNNLKSENIVDKVQISGNRKLGLRVLEMVSVMA